MCCDRWVAGLEELSREELIEFARGLIARVQELTRVNSELVAVNKALTGRVARLERLVSRNSGNSSMPASKDDNLGRTPPAEEPGSGKDSDGVPRRRGKREGAAGASLAWVPDATTTLDYFPAGVCGCGSDLSTAVDLGVYAAHQQTEIPLVVATVIQHDRHAVRCGCGRLHVAARPEGVPDAAVSYGPNLVSWCVYLMVAHALPVGRCADLVASLTGTRPSDGFVHALIGRAATAVADSNRVIRTLITLAHVVACDETPLRVGPRKARKHLLVACTALYTWYLLGDRSLATFEVFILADLTGVVVHDRYQNYDCAPFAHLVHQLCCQHLIRDCQDAAETYPHARWPVQVKQALRDLIHAANTARAQGLAAVPEHVAEHLIGIYRHGVRVGLAEIPRVPGRKQPKHRALLEDLRDREDDILRFVTDLRIPPTSNQAERDLRPAKTQQKISGRLTSLEVTAARYAVRGYISTVAKHGADILTAVRDAVLGRAWIPPAWTPG